MNRLLRIIAVVSIALVGTGASAATFTANTSVGAMGDVDTVAPLAGLFNFGGPVTGPVTSVTLTADPCDFSQSGCNDTLGTEEFYVFSFSGDVQNSNLGITPLGTPFDTSWTLAAATLTDLADGLLSFTVGCQGTAALSGDCSGVNASAFTLTVETGVIPIPAAGLLLLGGLGALAGMRRKKS